MYLFWSIKCRVPFIFTAQRQRVSAILSRSPLMCSIAFQWSSSSMVLGSMCRYLCQSSEQSELMIRTICSSQYSQVMMTIKENCVFASRQTYLSFQMRLIFSKFFWLSTKTLKRSSLVLRQRCLNSNQRFNAMRLQAKMFFSDSTTSSTSSWVEMRFLEPDLSLLSLAAIMLAMVSAGCLMMYSGLRQFLTMSFMGCGKSLMYFSMLFSQSWLISLLNRLRSVRPLHSSQMPLPLKMQMNTIPSEQMSAVLSQFYRLSTRSSMQAGEPTLDLITQLFWIRVLLPKSPILATFLAPIRMLSGLRSRCTML